MKILYVEDDPMMVKLYQSKFELEGFETIVAQDGKTALEKLAENPNLILLDLMLPAMDGFELLEKIKKDPKYTNVPVIVLSILGQDSDIARAKQLGAVNYLVKEEVTPARVVEIIRQYFSKGK